MEKFTISTRAQRPLPGTTKQAILGVVASGNLELLFERIGGDAVEIDVLTASTGYRAVWEAVIHDFVERTSPGGVRITIHDNGARPDTVMLRLMQGTKMLEMPS
ncbi:malonate decarboxylase acyl carrier protein [Acetobacter papayae]|mgnify:FL=1|uniref:malonate decarboxylase acyl carrier protein n=1 Tax=Acetobacter papayae TaxID=1076592 RepID=UPI0004707BD7|nr:malonate decarboxylase acyl carrier protein [Acetobacter papayae]